MTLTAEQRAVRLTGIGGSDAAAALGLSPWKSALELYHEKRGEYAPPAPDDERLLWGELLEPVIRQRYCDLTDRVITLPTATVRHPKFPWMLAHPDGLIANERRGVEIKTTGTGHGWGEPGTDQVPQHYMLQVTHYMGVMDLEAFDLAVLKAGQRLDIYTVEFDRELWDGLAEGERQFWQRLQDGNEPEPDWQSDRVLDVMRAIYPGTTGERLFASEADENYLAVYRDARQTADRYLDAVNSAKAHLLRTMGEASELVFADGTVMRRKRVKRKGYVVEPTEYVDARFVNPKKDA